MGCIGPICKEDYWWPRIRAQSKATGPGHWACLVLLSDSHMYSSTLRDAGILVQKTFSCDSHLLL
jgi:hypothetical protein